MFQSQAIAKQANHNMADNTNDIIQPMEYDLFIQSVKNFQVNEIGSREWFDSHEILIKFSQQAIIEASSYREELVKELFIINDKLKVLVHEAYCILVWRTKILPKISTNDFDGNATFILYSMLYHEATAVSLLETLLYHENGCAALGDVAMDLIDYCAQAVVQLIGLTHSKHFENCVDAQILSNENASEELERQQKDLNYKIGFRCLTILSFLTDKLDTLSIGIVRRMVVTHDVPCLMSEILHCRPWIRNVNGIEKYIDDKWMSVDGLDIMKLTKVEAQVWFCLRNLLFNRSAMSYYEINEFRQRELSKCQILLTVHVLDQLPPLAEVKHHLCTLPLSRSTSKSGNLILEEIPEIKNDLLSAAKQIGFKKIANDHVERFLRCKTSKLVKIAKRLNDAYNLDFIEKLDENKKISETKDPIDDKNFCAQCFIPAVKKCSSCERTFYCSRSCQVKHWAIHRNECQSN